MPVAYLRIGQLAGLMAVLLRAEPLARLRISVRTIADLPDRYLALPSIVLALNDRV